MSNYGIAVCSLGQIRLEHEMIMIQQRWPIGHGLLYIGITGKSVCEARNLAVQNAIDQELEYLMFWDDDVLPRRRHSVSNLLNALHTHPEMDIIGGVYPMRAEVPSPIVMEEDRSITWKWEDQKVHKVYMTGTGFIMMRLSSLLKIPDLPQVVINEEDTVVREYFSYNNDTTDDWNFAALCKENNLNWYVDGEIVCNQIRFEDGHQYRIEDAKTRLAPA